jgi:hypothetical protein
MDGASWLININQASRFTLAFSHSLDEYNRWAGIAQPDARMQSIRPTAHNIHEAPALVFPRAAAYILRIQQGCDDRQRTDLPAALVRYCVLAGEAMTSTELDVSRQAAQLANRLRAVQADLADQNAQTRQEYISDEIKRILAEIPPTQRPEFLSTLAEHFPSWDDNVVARQRMNSAGETQTIIGSNADAAELQDPAFLVQRLCELAPKLPQAQKEALIARLTEAGLAPASGPAWPGEPLAKLTARLQLDDDLQPHAGHTLELLQMLSELAMSIEQIAWNMWKAIVPNSNLRRGTPLQRLMSRFLADDPDVPRGQVAQELERLRKINAALLSSVGQTGRQFAHKYAARLAPAEIEAAVRATPKKMFAAIEVSCWKKYTELAVEHLDEAAIDHEIREIVREFVEGVI